jgi:hypothetical protein
MAQRYQSAAIAIGGATVVAHNLTGGTPTEYGFAPHSPSAAYFAGVSSTNLVIAAGIATGANCNVFCSIPYTEIQ